MAISFDDQILFQGAACALDVGGTWITRCSLERVIGDSIRTFQ